MSHQQQEILKQYASPEARSFYRHVMGAGSENMHYGLYHRHTTSMLEALNASTQRLLEMALTMVEPGSLKEILDLGAGAGGPAKCLISWTKARMTCVDLGAGPLQNLEKWAQAENLSAQLRTFNGSFQELPASWSGAFDLVWSQDALCHATDRLAVFAEAKRVLRPQGAFVFSDILLADNAPNNQAQAFTSVNAVLNLGTRQKYIQDLYQAGFMDIRCEDWTSHLPMNFKRMQQQIQSLGPDLLQAGVGLEKIESFSQALEQRLRWSSGQVLNWCAFLGKAA
jgi:sarcosine/dimethylglycine N-methyltransferase